MSCGGISLGYIKIKCIQSLDLWVMDLTLRGKNIDQTNLKSDILSDVIEEYRLNFEDTEDGNRELSNPKYFSHEKCNQW